MLLSSCVMRLRMRRGITAILVITGLFAILLLTGCAKPRVVTSPPPPPPPLPVAAATPPPPRPGPPAAKGPTAAPSAPLPSFPWPPPKPSTTVQIPSDAFKSTRNFGQLTALLNKALLDSGYSEIRYWDVPGGIAEVMHLERTYPDGRPAIAAQRWVVNSSPLRPLSISDYVQALFSNDPGYYRVVVFVITNVGSMPRSSTTRPTLRTCGI